MTDLCLPLHTFVARQCRLIALLLLPGRLLAIGGRGIIMGVLLVLSRCRKLTSARRSLICMSDGSVGSSW